MTRATLLAPIGHRAVAPVVTLVLAVLVLLPPALSLPVHPDETHYAWTAAYYGGKLARLDLAPAGSDPIEDPGWAPEAYWALTQPMGTRFVLALALGVSGAPAPARPYLFFTESRHEPARQLPGAARLATRLAAVACAAIGLSLLAVRLGWYGLFAAAFLLTLEHAREDLARGWAEGPLMLGLGLCVLAHGRAWFGAACGVAATFKLTALGVWPLLLLPGGGRSPRQRLAGLGLAAATWTALTPPAWFAGGPLYLLTQVVHRREEYAAQMTVLGPWIPTRYFLPLEVLIGLGLALLLRRLHRHLVRRARARADRARAPGAATPEPPSA